MILLPVDEAYAFDYYAILLVKSDNGLPVGRELTLVGESLKKQLHDLVGVIDSHEFRELYQANKLTFDAVAECKDSAAQKANRKRFEAKQRLQERFWPERPLTETKRKGD